MGAEFRLVSLVQTTELVNSSTEEISSPPINAVWVVARIDVVRRSDDPNLFCSLRGARSGAAGVGAEPGLRLP